MPAGAHEVGFGVVRWWWWVVEEGKELMEGSDQGKRSGERSRRMKPLLVAEEGGL